MAVRLSLQSQNFRRTHQGEKDISILFISSVGAFGQSGGRCRLINYMEDGEEVGGGAAKGRRGCGGTNLPTCCHFNAGGRVSLN